MYNTCNSRQRKRRNFERKDGRIQGALFTEYRHIYLVFVVL